MAQGHLTGSFGGAGNLTVDEGPTAAHNVEKFSSLQQEGKELCFMLAS